LRGPPLRRPWTPAVIPKGISRYRLQSTIAPSKSHGFKIAADHFR
jgi:hypothetical protein